MVSGQPFEKTAVVNKNVNRSKTANRSNLNMVTGQPFIKTDTAPGTKQTVKKTAESRPSKAASLAKSRNRARKELESRRQAVNDRTAKSMDIDSIIKALENVRETTKPTRSSRQLSQINTNNANQNVYVPPTSPFGPYPDYTNGQSLFNDGITTAVYNDTTDVNLNIDGVSLKTSAMRINKSDILGK
jgi:hypothetical protein